MAKGLRYRSAFASRTTTTMENYFRYLEFWSLGDEEPEFKSQSHTVTNPIFQSRICFVFFLIGWVARSIGEAVAEPILIAIGVKFFKHAVE